MNSQPEDRQIVRLMQEFCKQCVYVREDLILISLFLNIEFDLANDVKTNKKKLLYAEKGRE